MSSRNPLFKVPATLYVNGMNIHAQTIDDELAQLRRVAWRMDALFYIPRTNISVGLDNILGLIPVIGDVATVAPAIWLVWKAHKLGATPGAIAYMSCNIMADVLIGSIPIAGDIFDVFYNANIRNYRLLEKNLEKVAAQAQEVRQSSPQKLAA